MFLTLSYAKFHKYFAFVKNLLVTFTPAPDKDVRGKCEPGCHECKTSGHCEYRDQAGYNCGENGKGTKGTDGGRGGNGGTGGNSGHYGSFKKGF